MEAKSSLKAKSEKQEEGEIGMKPDHENCKFCMLMKKGDCWGSRETCEFFKSAGCVSDEEKANWPTECDASYIRRTGKRRK